MRRVLLDENLPQRLAQELPDFDVHTVAEVGWAGAKNGDLLRLAESKFDLFVTADRNLPEQQNLSVLGLGIVILQAHSTKPDDLLPLVLALLDALKTARPGQTLIVSGPQSRD